MIPDMKILITDDEKLTRSGLISSIDWEALGIDTILEASNGSEGLLTAQKEKPDIILTDMRMPHMDGVAMAERIQTILPDSAVIFMSGYSDREYLKAAITLKAVSYVEKPLDPAEVAGAVREAAKQLIEKGLVKRGRSQELKEHEDHLAELMTRACPPETFDAVTLPDPMRYDDHFTCLILRFHSDQVFSVNMLYQTTGRELKGLLERYRLHELHIVKENNCLCLFLYGEKPSRSALIKLSEGLFGLWSIQGLNYISVGDTFRGVSHAYNSYASAVIMLQEAFFNPPGSILAADGDTSPSPPMINDCSAEYADSLSSGNKEEADRILKDLRGQFDTSCRLLASQVKDIYYRLFLSLQKMARQAQIPDVVFAKGRSIWDMVELSETIDCLHGELEKCTNAYFSGLEGRETGSSMVFAIKEFIMQNYQNEALSIKSISEHVNRSAPYVCTFFKAETGQTLNQYITAYRIERAQEMLADPRYKITDVAARTGYADVNYFGKIFKKVSGISPSEYRLSLTSGKKEDG